MVTGRPTSSADSQTPYRLHRLLLAHQIQHADLREHLTYSRGRREGEKLAPSTLSQLLVRRMWPGSLNPEAIKDATAKFLRDRGVAEDDIAQAWELDGELRAGEQRERVWKPVSSQSKRSSAQPEEEPFPIPEPEMLSQSAREHFNITRHPFLDDVQGPQDVYLSKDQRYIRASMYDAARNSGLLAVVGESGSGKTTLRRDLLERIRTEAAPIVVIQPQTVDKGKLTTAHICDAIITDLSTEKPKQSLEAKARQVQRILTASSKQGTSHVLIIEEAHDLSVATLKYLKRFWEMEDGFKKLIGIILVGQPELGARLDERRNYDAREVIRRTEIATLKPLNGNLEEYLTMKFKRVGIALDTIFEKNAFDAIRSRLTRQRPNNPTQVESHLYPLVVHNLVIKCMNQAPELGLVKINADLVGRV